MYSSLFAYYYLMFGLTLRSIYIYKLLYVVAKSQFTEYFNKKLFFFFYPHTLTIRLKRPVYRAFSGEGWCEGVRVKW